MNYDRPGLLNLHTIGATVFWRYAQEATAQKILRIADLNFQDEKCILQYVLRPGKVQ